MIIIEYFKSILDLSQNKSNELHILKNKINLHINHFNLE